MSDTELTRHELDDLYGATLVEALTAEVTVLSGPQGDGVIDDDVYRRLAMDIRGNGGTVVADLSGSRLDAVLAGGVDVLKVSEEELERDGRIERDAGPSGRRWRPSRGPAPVETRGAGDVRCVERDVSRPRQRDPRADRTPGEPRPGRGPIDARMRR